MIRIFDSDTLNHLYKNDIRILEEHECSVPDDIQSEFLTLDEAERWFKSCVFSELKLDESDYLTEYSHYLNIYNKVSFYAMKGFGDVALLAVISLLIKEGSQTPTLSDVFFPEDVICLVSRDQNLRKFAIKHFPRIHLETPEEFVNRL